MHVIFVYFICGGFCTKIKCMRKVQSKLENMQRSATVRKFMHTKGQRAQDMKIESVRNILDFQYLDLLKGQCHDIQWFFALFLREQKMAVARASVADIRSESLAVRAAWQPGHLRWLLT